MKIRILGAGWYGSHIGSALIQRGHVVEVYDIADRIFAGASGNIPARLHAGFHYPRSRMTRAACQEHLAAFMGEYGFLTRGVPVNIYAIAAQDSLVDFDQYTRTLAGEVPFVPIHDPAEFGLQNVEGAILTGERHILADAAREHFGKILDGCLYLQSHDNQMDARGCDWTIDCTFGAQSSAGVDRYEPCLVVLLNGPTDRAVTVMDGGFPSLYPWDEERGLSSLSSALWTPFSKCCRTYAEASILLNGLTEAQVEEQAERMIASMAEFYPDIREYQIADFMLSVRAMPRSGADTRLVDVAAAGERLIRVRAGKIDAIIHAEHEIERMIGA